MPDFRIPSDREQPAVLGDFNSPEREWGGADPRGIEAPDGSWFWSALEKDSVGVLRLVVYRVSPTNTILMRWADSGIVGQGGLQLQPNGRLDAVGFLGFGDNQTRRAIPVPQWPAPRPPASGATLPARYVTALNKLCAMLGI